MPNRSDSDSGSGSGSGERLSPTRLGRYQLLRKIAVGGMAEIYLARVSGAGGFEKHVVVKRILPQLAESDEFFRMFLDEARIAATLQHPNVVQVFDAQEEDGEHFIAMEYLDGADLHTIRRILAEKRQGLPIQHSVYIVGSVAAGLHYAHNKAGLDGQALHIVHRDVTPQNILVTREGGVKLVDFGIAKAANRASSTGYGTLKGKLAYMSPEQCRADAVDHRSDIFSLGIILFELTTGKRLYRGKSEYEILREIVEDQVPAPSSLVAGYPLDLEPIVLRALARNPAERYQTARELEQALERFARGRGVVGSALALAEFAGPLIAEAQRQAEARIARRAARAAENLGSDRRRRRQRASGGESGAAAQTGSEPAGEPTAASRPAATPAPTPAMDGSDVTPTPASGSASLPMPLLDSGQIRLRRSRLGPMLLLLVLVGGAVGAFYYVRLQRGAAVAAADAGPGAVAPPAQGTIRVNSTPAGAAVWLRLGLAPVDSPALDPSRPHLLRVERDGYLTQQLEVAPDAFKSAADGRVAQVAVALKPIGGTASPPADPTEMPGGGAAPTAPGAPQPDGHLHITTDPASATVWLLVGVTPARLGPLATATTRELRVARTGFLPAFVSVTSSDFNAAGDARMRATLTATGGASGTAPPGPDHHHRHHHRDGDSPSAGDTGH